MRLPHVQIRLILPDGKSFGPGKAELLDHIDRLGSISAAGRAMKMSYKRAWSLVEEMNAGFVTPLVMAERGGSDRGGARVTDLGRAVLASYNRLIGAVQGTGELEFVAERLKPAGKSLSEGAAPDMFDQT